MSEYERSVFISYAWGKDDEERESIVNQLDQALQKRGLKIIRDKRDLGYRGLIREFMERIGEGSCVIVVISDKYLRSKNCMYELVEIAKNQNFVNRVFPIVLPDAKIYDAIDRLNYKKYWKQKKEELNKEILSLGDVSNITGISEELNDYDRFGDEFDKLTTTLKNMNSLSPELLQDADFQQLYDAIEKRMKEDKPADNGEFQNKKREKDESAKGINPSKASTINQPMGRLRATTSKSEGVFSQQRKKYTSSRSSTTQEELTEELIISRRLLKELNDAQRELNEYINGYIMLIEPWVDCSVAKSKLDEKDVSNEKYWKEIKSLLKRASGKLDTNIPDSLTSITQFRKFRDSLLKTLELVQGISNAMTEPEKEQINEQAFDCIEDAVNMVDNIGEQCQKATDEKIGHIKGLISRIFETDQEHNKVLGGRVQKPDGAVGRSRGDSYQPLDNPIANEERLAVPIRR